MNGMTLEQLEALPGEVLTCQQIGQVIGANPDSIRGQARERPELLGFPVIVCGSRVRIPKQPFINFMRKGKSN